LLPIVYIKNTFFYKMPGPFSSIGSTIYSTDRNKVLVALKKGSDPNGFVHWDSSSACATKLPISEVAEGQEGKIYKALPLNIAVIKGNVEIVKELLKAGANPTLKDGRKR
jgi:hypothetical protein